MGVEFKQSTSRQKESVEKFIHALMNSNGVEPELLVEPDSLETEVEGEAAIALTANNDLEDPLIELFQHKSNLPAEAFLHELRTQRQSPEPSPSALSV